MTKIFRYTLADIIAKKLNEGAITVKNSIIDPLTEESLKPQEKVTNFENKLCEIENVENKLELNIPAETIKRFSVFHHLLLTNFLRIK